jgi:hypothetical protein
MIEAKILDPAPVPQLNVRNLDKLADALRGHPDDHAASSPS